MVGWPPGDEDDCVLSEDFLQVLEILFDPVWTPVMDEPQLTSENKIKCKFKKKFIMSSQLKIVYNQVQ